MNMKIMVIVVCMLFIITASSTIGIDISNDVNDADLITSNYIEDTYLLTTTWGQWEYYNAKCPIDPDTGKPHRLGCKSVAIGQIMRYHELESHGLVEYYYDNNEGDPIPLINDLDDFDYDWAFMADWLNGSHTPEEEDHVSAILYDSATVIQKNFGWDDYVINASRMIKEIIDHFYYVSVQSEVVDLPDIQEIKDEIDGFRPCMLYLERIAGGGHAVVLDGYRTRQKFEVHLNFGWDGSPEDGWYVYDEPIHIYDNNSIRKLYFIRISPNKPEKPVGPITGSPEIDYPFSSKTTVKNNLPIYYRWDWDDGTFSDWMGRYESGEICEATHTYKQAGKYSVKVKAKDVNGWESPWSDPLAIEMPRTKDIDRPFLQFLQRFPNLFAIISHFLEL